MARIKNPVREKGKNYIKITKVLQNRRKARTLGIDKKNSNFEIQT